MNLKLYCNRYSHFKDPLVCSVNCPYRTRCHDFALYYDEHRERVDRLVEDYFAARNGAGRPRGFLPLAPVATEIRTILRLEVKREMTEPTYIWIAKDGQAELLSLEEIIKRAEDGAKAQHIFKVAQEMELRFQLVPRKGIEKARRSAAVDAERAAARRKPLRPVEVETESPAVAEIPADQNARRARGRAGAR